MADTFVIELWDYTSKNYILNVWESRGCPITGYSNQIVIKVPSNGNVYFSTADLKTQNAVGWGAKRNNTGTYYRETAGAAVLYDSSDGNYMWPFIGVDVKNDGKYFTYETLTYEFYDGDYSLPVRSTKLTLLEESKKYSWQVPVYYIQPKSRSCSQAQFSCHNSWRADEDMYQVSVFISRDSSMTWQNYYSNLHYDLNGGVNSSGTAIVDDYDVYRTSSLPNARTVTINTEYIPKLTAYIFKGWSTTKYAPGTYSTSLTEISVPYSTTNSATAVLYAMWEKNLNPISRVKYYNKNGTWVRLKTTSDN